MNTTSQGEHTVQADGPQTVLSSLLKKSPADSDFLRRKTVPNARRRASRWYWGFFPVIRFERRVGAKARFALGVRGLGGGAVRDARGLGTTARPAGVVTPRASAARAAARIWANSS